MTPLITPKGTTVNVLVNTEVWNRSTGKVAKTVLRTEKGTFLGATNQTKEIPTAKVVRPRVKFVVR